MDGVARVAVPPPQTAQDLQRLVLTQVPSGLPRLPDDDLRPPAGEKGLDDVARYAQNPSSERNVLDDYGYRFGWERFWGTGTGAGPTTSVFVYEFRDWLGAAVYARDLAGNDAQRYGGMPAAQSPDLPRNCWSLRVDAPRPATGLAGPAASVWCAHGVFSVSVTAVATSPQAAAAEVHGVLSAQLARLPL